MILHTHTSVIFVGVCQLDIALPRTMTSSAYAPWPWEGHCQPCFGVVSLSSRGGGSNH